MLEALKLSSVLELLVLLLLEKSGKPSTRQHSAFHASHNCFLQLILPTFENNFIIPSCLKKRACNSTKSGDLTRPWREIKTRDAVHHSEGTEFFICSLLGILLIRNVICFIVIVPTSSSSWAAAGAAARRKRSTLCTRRWPSWPG